MTRKTGFLDFRLFQRVVDEITGFSEPVRSKEIELFHFGESLLHPEVDKMAGYATQRGLKVVLSVNAPVLSADLSERILRNNPFMIILSLDGSDQESYKKIRGPAADFAKACRNIEFLVRLHERLGSETKLVARMIELNENRGYRAQFKGTLQNSLPSSLTAGKLGPVQR